MANGRISLSRLSFKELKRLNASSVFLNSPSHLIIFFALEFILLWACIILMCITDDVGSSYLSIYGYSVLIFCLTPGIYVTCRCRGETARRILLYESYLMVINLLLTLVVSLPVFIHGLGLLLDFYMPFGKTTESIKSWVNVLRWVILILLPMVIFNGIYLLVKLGRAAGNPLLWGADRFSENQIKFVWLAKQRNEPFSDDQVPPAENEERIAAPKNRRAVAIGFALLILVMPAAVIFSARWMRWGIPRAFGIEVAAEMKYRAAADAGDLEAQYQLGMAYEFGRGVAEYPRYAMAWYRRAAEKGHVLSLYRLGVNCEAGKGSFLGVKRAESAAPWYRRAAEKGHAPSQCRLGVFYAKGWGVDRNPKKAVEWYRKAAVQGFAQAQFYLGACYAQGAGVEKDLKHAAEWYRKAAVQGHAPAQFRLGGCYARGEGVPQDHKQAAEWYRKSADQNVKEAQFALGECFMKGEGVPQNTKQAIYWYRRAAERDYRPAKRELEEIKDKFVKRRTAAEKGDADAQYDLGDCYENGVWVDKDLKQAAEWYRKAAAQGHEDAKKALKRLGY